MSNSKEVFIIWFDEDDADDGRDCSEPRLLKICKTREQAEKLLQEMINPPILAEDRATYEQEKANFIFKQSQEANIVLEKLLKLRAGLREVIDSPNAHLKMDREFFQNLDSFKSFSEKEQRLTKQGLIKTFPSFETWFSSKRIFLSFRSQVCLSDVIIWKMLLKAK